MKEEKYKVVNKTKIFDIAMFGLKKILTKSMGEWIKERMTTEGVSLRKQKR
jgi:hypothetical protein